MTHPTLPLYDPPHPQHDPPYLTQPHPCMTHLTPPRMTHPMPLVEFENSQMDMSGCVWVGESFLRNDKWQIKLLSEFISILHSTFYEWLKLKK